MTIVNIDEHPASKEVRVLDELENARRRIQELEGENELLQRKRADYVREGAPRVKSLGFRV